MDENHSGRRVTMRRAAACLRSITAVLALAFCCPALSVRGDSLVVDQTNIASILYLGGALNLACFGPDGRIGRLSLGELQAGARLAFIRARKQAALRKSRMLRLKTALARLSRASARFASLQAKKRKLVLETRQLRAAVKDCALFTELQRRASSSSNSSSSPEGRAPGSYAAGVSQYGVSWTFDREYLVGQFVNGDWWVAGPVTITEIHPAAVYNTQATAVDCSVNSQSPIYYDAVCTEIAGAQRSCVEGKCTYNTAHNGYQVNPSGGGKQTLESRGYKGSDGNYSAAARPPALPSVFQPGASIVSAVSNPLETNCSGSGGCAGWRNYLGDCVCLPLETAAVLTVLDAAPPQNSFRPPFAGSGKKTYLFHWEQIMSKLLSLAPPANMPEVEQTIRAFQRPWLDYVYEWSGQYIRPMNNMQGYGAQIARQVGDGLLTALSEIPLEQKKRLLINLLQVGIDLHAVLQSGGGWPANGGHASGRKAPILFAGVMLEDAGMKAVGTAYGPEKFGEDCQTYYDDNPGFPFFHGILGFPRWGIGHCRDLAGSRADLHDESSGYRTCCNSESWRGQTLAMRLLGLERLWNHQPYFDYQDRWADDGEQGHHGSAFAKSMWDLYRGQIGTCRNRVWDRCSVECKAAAGTRRGEGSMDCGGGCPC